MFDMATDIRLSDSEIGFKLAIEIVDKVKATYPRSEQGLSKSGDGLMQERYQPSNHFKVTMRLLTSLWPQCGLDAASMK